MAVQELAGALLETMCARDQAWELRGWVGHGPLWVSEPGSPQTRGLQAADIESMRLDLSFRPGAGPRGHWHGALGQWSKAFDVKRGLQASVRENVCRTRICTSGAHTHPSAAPEAKRSRTGLRLTSPHAPPPSQHWSHVMGLHRRALHDLELLHGVTHVGHRHDIKGARRRAVQKQGMEPHA